MNTQLHISDTPEATARAVADRILKLAKEKAKNSLPFNVALSGGSTPALLFRILAADYQDSIPWHIVRLFWVDERCVPPTHVESNFRMTFDNLLQAVPIHDSNIFRMYGESEPEKEAKRYSQLLENELAHANSLPIFDLILLGMGDDGHTASIFPDNPALLDVEQTVAVGTHPVSGQKRITLTGRVLNAAAEVAFLVTGSSKSTVLKQIINREKGFEKYPSSYIQPGRGVLTFYVDKAAASDLSE